MTTTRPDRGRFTPGVGTAGRRRSHWSRRSGPTRGVNRNGVGDLALVATVVTWAAAFPAIRVGLEGYSPWSLGLLRLLAASVALALVAARLRTPLPPRRLWARVVLAGLLGQALYQGFLMNGEVRVPAGTASILIAIAPIFSVVAGAVLLHEPIGRRWPGMLLGFAGAALVGASLGLGGGTAALYVLAAAACQGLYHVVVKPLAQEIGAFAATAWSLWAGAVLALPALPSLVSELPSASGGATLGAVFLGIVPSAIGYLTWSYAVARTTLARSTASLYLVPVVALLLAWWWLGERPAALALLGGALAVLGVVVIRRGGPNRPSRMRQDGRRAAPEREHSKHGKRVVGRGGHPGGADGGA